MNVDSVASTPHGSEDWTFGSHRLTNRLRPHNLDINMTLASPLQSSWSMNHGYTNHSADHSSSSEIAVWRVLPLSTKTLLRPFHWYDCFSSAEPIPGPSTGSSPRHDPTLTLPTCNHVRTPDKATKVVKSLGQISLGGNAPRAPWNRTPKCLLRFVPLLVVGWEGGRGMHFFQGQIWWSLSPANHRGLDISGDGE